MSHTTFLLLLLFTYLKTEGEKIFIASAVKLVIY